MMRKIIHILGFGLALTFATVSFADDTDLFESETVSVDPRVMFLLDTSNSMNAFRDLGLLDSVLLFVFGTVNSIGTILGFDYDYRFDGNCEGRIEWSIFGITIPLIDIIFPPPKNSQRKICILRQQLTTFLTKDASPDSWEDDAEVGLSQYALPGAIILAPVARLGDGSPGTHRAKLLTLVNKLRTNKVWQPDSNTYQDLSWGTPLVGGYLEIAEYLTGGKPVSLSSSSYSNSAVWQSPALATDYKGIGFESMCSTNNTHFVVLTDGESDGERMGSHARYGLDVLIGDLFGLTDTLGKRVNNFIGGTPGEYNDACESDINSVREILGIIDIDGFWSKMDRRYFDCLGLLTAELNQGTSESGDRYDVKTHVIAFNVYGLRDVLSGVFRDYTLGDLMRRWASAGQGGFYSAETGEDLAQAISAITRSAKFDGAYTSTSGGVGVSQLNQFAYLNELYFSTLTPSANSFWYGNLKKYYFGIDDEGEVGVYFDASKTKKAVDDQGRFLDGITEWSRNVLDEPFDRDGQVAHVGGAAGNIEDQTQRRLFTYLGDSRYRLGGASDAAETGFLKDYMLADYLASNPPPSGSEAEVEASQSAKIDSMLRWLKGEDVLGEWIRLANLHDEDTVIATDDRLNRQDRRNFYGAPLHSSPVLVNYKSRTADGEALVNPENVIFVSTNDGKLYAVDAATGEEKLAFLPQAMITSPGAGKLSPVERMYDAIAANAAGNLIYGLDSTWTVWRQDMDRDGNINPADGDFVYLYGGMRRGGNNYYILDASEVGGANSELEQEAVLVGGKAGTEFENSGQSWSEPRLAVVKFKGVSVAVFIVGGGYDPVYDDGRPESLPTKGAQLYIIAAHDFTAGTTYEAGDVLWWASSEGLATGNHVQVSSLEYSIPSTVKTLEIDGDGYLDHIYVGDMGGQIHRFDINNESTTAIDLASATLIAQLGVAGDNVADTDFETDRRFFHPPSVAVMQDSVFGRFVGLAIGSGWQANPKDEDVDEKFYFLIDYAPVDTIKGAAATVVTEEATTSSGNSVIYPLSLTTDQNDLGSAIADADEIRGFSIALENTAEKLLGSPLIIGGTAYFSTYYLDDSATGVDSCEPTTGEAALYSVPFGRANGFQLATGLNQNVAGSVQSLISQVLEPLKDADGNIIGEKNVLRGGMLSGTGAIGDLPVNLQQVRKSLWRAEQ